VEIEISYASSDAEVADDVTSALAKAEDISAGEPREARQLDPTTVIGPVGGVVALTSALIDLRERLRKRKEARSANYTGTHGASLVGFAFTELLGF
jgi:hypothetical protein